MNEHVRKTDPEIADILDAELKRQQGGIELIASENFPSIAVLEAQGSVLTNKYAEGYPSRRYYGGCEIVDKAEGAAKLGKAILEDQERPPASRTFTKPLRIYTESYLSNINFPYWMTVYNAFGFFMLIGLFLWRPIQNYLGTQGKKTAVALRNARDAQDEVEEFRNKYRALSGELEKQDEKLRGDVDKTIEQDRTDALENARRQAESIAGGIEYALKAEAERRAGRLSEHAAREACSQARKILEKRLGQAEHDAAIEELIADIGGMRFNQG